MNLLIKQTHMLEHCYVQITMLGSDNLYLTKEVLVLAFINFFFTVAEKKLAVLNVSIY